MDSATKKGPVEIVFDGPPSHQAGRFVEVEQDGVSFSIGKWRERPDGMWSLDLPKETRAAIELADALTALRASHGHDGGCSCGEACRSATAALRAAGRDVK